MMRLYQHLVIEEFFQRNKIDILFYSEPTNKALSRMVNSNSASQADEPSERANQMIMVRNFLFHMLF
jgi:hypothetical protein